MDGGIKNPELYKAPTKLRKGKGTGELTSLCAAAGIIWGGTVLGGIASTVQRKVNLAALFALLSCSSDVPSSPLTLHSRFS